MSLNMYGGIRQFLRSIHVRAVGFYPFGGSAGHICRQIVEACWNGRYFQTSLGNFSEFWTRDFGLCCGALMNLGYGDKVRRTYQYALGVFSKNNKITTAIDPRGRPFDFPCYAPDSLAFLLHGLVAAGFDIEPYREFLKRMVCDYHSVVVGEDGLVKRNTHFSSMRDHAIRDSACYDNVMAAWAAGNAEKLGLGKARFDHKKIIKDNFWNGRCFIDDLSGKKMITGDANVFPFWSGVFGSEKMIRSAVDTLRGRGLDKPFPMKYYHNRDSRQKMIWESVFARNYEADAIWMHLGQAYIDVVMKIDRKLAQAYLRKYGETIEKYRTYVEVFDSSGKPYRSPFYFADEGMLWSAMYLNAKTILTS
ncbi:MAG: hypothetical protein ABH879_04425 [archaeon]